MLRCIEAERYSQVKDKCVTFVKHLEKELINYVCDLNRRPCPKIFPKTDRYLFVVSGFSNWINWEKTLQSDDNK